MIKLFNSQDKIVKELQDSEFENIQIKSPDVILYKNKRYYRVMINQE